MVPFDVNKRQRSLIVDCAISRSKSVLLLPNLVLRWCSTCPFASVKSILARGEVGKLVFAKHLSASWIALSIVSDT